MAQAKARNIVRISGRKSSLVLANLPRMFAESVFIDVAAALEALEIALEPADLLALAPYRCSRRFSRG